MNPWRWVRNLIRSRRFHLVRTAELYAEGRDCDNCGEVMHIKDGVIFKWDNGTMTVKHARCPK